MKRVNKNIAISRFEKNLSEFYDKPTDENLQNLVRCTNELTLIKEKITKDKDVYEKRVIDNQRKLNKVKNELKDVNTMIKHVEYIQANEELKRQDNTQG
jgi:hypothetical protein